MNPETEKSRAEMVALEKELIKKVSDQHDADVFIFNGGISHPNADRLIIRMKEVKNKKVNCVLILTTFGGDADAGFRIVRHIHRKYTKLIVYVLGFCKSAGTLIASTWC